MEGEKEYLTNYDLESLLIEYKKGGSRSLVSDIDLLLYLYSASTSNHELRRITKDDFVKILM
jgi:hypothetical protein